MTKGNGLLRVDPARKFPYPPDGEQQKNPKRVGPKEGNFRGGGGGFVNKIGELLFVLWQWLTVHYLLRK